MSNRHVTIPIELAEFLHAALGPLGDVLADEKHPWAAMVKEVLDQYVQLRDAHVVHEHGEAELPYVYHATYLAVEMVSRLSERLITEAEDFVAWSREVDDVESLEGESA